LREHELELVACHLFELRAGFRADTDPLDFAGRWESPVRLDCYAKALAVQGANERSVDLQHRFAARQKDQQVAALARPSIDARLREISCGGEFAAARSIRTNEVRVAKPARSRGTIGFPA
jgi:hypothetical protein